MPPTECTVPECAKQGVQCDCCEQAKARIQALEQERDELLAIRERNHHAMDLARLSCASLRADCNRVDHAMADVSAELERLKAACPDDIRQQGWAVAAHNDYRQDGRMYTFWLVTRAGRCLKGEGSTDAEALNQIRSIIAGHDVTTTLTLQQERDALQQDWERINRDWHAKQEQYEAMCDDFVKARTDGDDARTEVERLQAAMRDALADLTPGVSPHGILTDALNPQQEPNGG